MYRSNPDNNLSVDLCDRLDHDISPSTPEAEGFSDITAKAINTHDDNSYNLGENSATGREAKIISRQVSRTYHPEKHQPDKTGKSNTEAREFSQKPKMHKN